MRKPDELTLFRRARGEAVIIVPELAAELGIPEKRAQIIVRKWGSRGWTEYGSSERAQWWTNAAPTELAP